MKAVIVLLIVIIIGIMIGAPRIVVGDVVVAKNDVVLTNEVGSYVCTISEGEKVLVTMIFYQDYGSSQIDKMFSVTDIKDSLCHGDHLASNFKK